MNLCRLLATSHLFHSLQCDTLHAKVINIEVNVDDSNDCRRCKRANDVGLFPKRNVRDHEVTRQAKKGPCASKHQNFTLPCPAHSCCVRVGISMAATEGPTFRSLVAAFTDFLTVAIHTILYERRIYPQTSFLSARKYNFPVRQNRHPKVCEWINDAVTAVENELLKGTVERVVVVIYTKSGTPTERFLFDVSRFPAVPVADADTPLRRTSADGETVAVLPTVDMEEQCRATIGKIANCGTVLRSLPEGCTFTIAIELKSESHPPLGHPQPWIPAQPKGSQESSGGRADPATAVPLRAVAAGDMIFESWIEESASYDEG